MCVYKKKRVKVYFPSDKYVTRCRTKEKDELLYRTLREVWSCVSPQR